MLHGGRRSMAGRRWRTAGSTPLCPGRTPLSQRSTTNGNLANTPATPPSRTRLYTGSPSRQRLRGVTGCVRWSATTPKRGTGKRLAVNFGARVRGSGGGSGKKRIRAKTRAPLTGGLQPLVEQRLADADYDAQQTQPRTEALLRKEIANAEADAEARRKVASSEPASGPGRKTRDGKRR